MDDLDSGSDLVSIWHSARLPILWASFSLAACIQVWIFLRRRSLRAKEEHQGTVENRTTEKQEEENSHISTIAGAKASPTTPLAVQPSLEQSIAAATNPPKQKARLAPKRVVGKRTISQKPKDTPIEQVQPLVFFSSLSGSTEKAATGLVAGLSQTLQTSKKNILTPKLLDLSDIDYDDYFTSLPKSSNDTTPIRYFYILLVPSYNIDTYLDNFLEHLRETHHDFRIDTAPLAGILGYAVFGFGDKTSWPTEETGFCSQAIEVDKWLARLTAKRRAYPVGMGDVSSDATEKLQQWRSGMEEVVKDLASGKSFGEGVPGSGNAVESDDEEQEEEAAEINNSSSMTDMENLGGLVSEVSAEADESLPIDFTTYRSSKEAPAPKAMVPVSSPTYTALTKQGYTIIGTHSGVKLCRWTKSALRGRGSCYKYSFYGIQSHLCMETTPSLSCSNKCVFCWRHGTNPVGTTWRWQVDPPDMIFNGAKAGHYQKIKIMRGVPGVRAERFEEAMRIRHCALSLVGEPIFYPHINEFLSLLHGEHISSFLVCNAQHPDQLATLGKVTQLYVSIDASNAESLRRIDRPLHRDYWQRFTRCLDILHDHRFSQRTVFRLTLVKGFNIADEAEGYAELVARALPCFVEVKGVTYCGTSTASGAGLTMQNVPFYSEVCEFVEALNDALARRGLDYGIAAEHAHSCCILLASKRFFIPSARDGVSRWHTQIDYQAFFRLLESGKPFQPEEYIAETPGWAVWGNGGFDPRDTRVKKKGRQGGEMGIGELEAKRRMEQREETRLVEVTVEAGELVGAGDDDQLVAI